MGKYVENLNNSLLLRVGRDSLPQRLCESFDGTVPAAGVLGELVAKACEKGWTGNLWHCCLAEALLMSENPYSLAYERRTAEGSSLKRLAFMDMDCWKKLFGVHFDFPAWEEIADFRFSDEDIPAEADTPVTMLAEKMGASKSVSQMLDVYSDFLEKYGCGVFALANRFRLGDGIVPLEGGRNFGLDELVGYESQKALLKENTEKFLAGRGGNNVLLYGDAGTGKSTSIQALASEYASSGLRIIEIHKHQFEAIPGLLDMLRGRNYRFILLLDDLSFEENETQYKYLKAVMEGGARSAPENVRIYATSNRRHLIRENWSDRSDMEHDGDIHRSDTMEEKLSLAGRFGLQIFYPSPDFDEYQHIVAELAARNGTVLSSEELKKQAATWQVRHGSRSGRTAKQFIDSL